MFKDNPFHTKFKTIKRCKLIYSIVSPEKKNNSNNKHFIYPYLINNPDCIATLRKNNVIWQGKIYIGVTKP